MLTLLLSVLVGPAAAESPGDLELVLEAAAVTVRGVTAGGTVTLAAVSREPHGHSSSVSRRDESLTDGDGDGTVELRLETEVPQRSVWVAVDAATGRATFASPDGFPLRLEEVPPGWLVASDASGSVDRLDLAGRSVDLLVVRPGVGAWGATVFDGSPEDEDGPANNRVSPRLGRLTPLHAGPPAPERLQPLDVVVVIDTSSLEVFATRAPGPQA